MCTFVPISLQKISKSISEREGQNMLRSSTSIARAGVRAVSKVPLIINGQEVQSKTSKWIEVHNPATQEVVSLVPVATQDEMKAAVDSAQQAFSSWRNTPVTSRQRVISDFLGLIKRHQQDIAQTIVRENGKTMADALGDVFRGIEVVEKSTSVASDMMGQTLEQLARNVDTYTYYQPLGVCAGIGSFLSSSV